MTRVLFVCLGNICRSTMAEGIFNHLVKERACANLVESDSAGTGSWHIGQPANHNTLRILSDRGIAYSGRGRQVDSSDFQEFDHLVAMDESNYRDLLHWPGSKPEKVSLMLSWHAESPVVGVPDPYYGGPDGFEGVYELLVPACEGLLNHILSKQVDTCRVE